MRLNILVLVVKMRMSGKESIKESKTFSLPFEGKGQGWVDLRKMDQPESPLYLNELVYINFTPLVPLIRGGQSYLKTRNI